jgi:cell division protein ZapA
MDPGMTTVRIFGQEYSIRSESDGDHVKRVAALVDEKMREVSNTSSQVSSVKVAILAALNLADELVSLRRGEMRSVEELESRARRMARALEDALTDPQSAEEGAAEPAGSDASLRVSESEAS